MDTVKTTNVRLLRIISIADSSIFLWPVVILFYYKVAGNAAGAGVLLSVRAIASAIGELPTGYFSDKFGRARTTQLACFLYLMSAIATAASWTIGFRLLLVAVIVQGVAEACVSGNHDSLLFESSDDKDNYERNSGWFITASSAASMTSAVVGGIVGYKSLLIVAYISILPRVVSFASSFWIRDIVEIQASTGSTIRKVITDLKALMIADRQMRFVLIGWVIAQGFGEVSWQFRALFVKLVWPLWALGLSLPISHGAGALGGYLYNRFSKQLKRYNPIVIVSTTTIIGRSVLIVSLLIQSVASPIILGLSGVIGPLNKISFTSLLHGRLHNQVRASGFSVLNLATTGLFSVASLVFGVLIDHIGVRKALVICTCCALVSVVFYKLALLVPEKTTARG